ncbi:MAG TPA: HAD family hydrolase [Candidatus Eisenbacteria bacterium]|nr:HAD family hydrolase [Candidatus Eisenbacteria bacterium]
MPRAVLFDLDDTLIDYSGAVEACWDRACALAAQHGLDVAAVARTVHDVRRWFWADRERHARERTDMLGAWTKIVAIALGRLGHASDALAAAVASDFAVRREAATTLFADVIPCLTALRARGVAVGCVTNGDARLQRAKLARHGLAALFDAIVIEGEFGAGKPDPAVYRHVLGALGATPGEATMVGDNLEWDVAGPLRLGMNGVWIDRGGSGLPPGASVRPTRVIRSLAEL